MSYLFSSESVSEGHPDKVADQISDAILDQFLAYDEKARVACETFVTTGQVVIMGRYAVRYISTCRPLPAILSNVSAIPRQSTSSMVTHAVS